MKLKFIDFKDLFDSERLITSSEILDSKKKKFNDEGIFSEKLFGNYSDASVPAHVIGWINFGENYIISPIFYDRLKSVFTNKILVNMISYNKETNEQGKLIDAKKKFFEDQDIGLIEFRERFPELLAKYGKENSKEYDIIVNAYNDGLLFTNIFPVFSSKLRPAILIAATTDSDPVLKKDSINNHYNFLIEYSLRLNDIIGDDEDDDVKLRKLNLLFMLQEYANKTVVSIINDFLKGKKGIFRKIIASTRVNFSARNVITPCPDGNINDVELPYITFLELYRFLLINLITKAEKISYNKAEEYFESCRTHFDPKMYKYMETLIKNSKDGINVIINRNP